MKETKHLQEGIKKQNLQAKEIPRQMKTTCRYLEKERQTDRELHMDTLQTHTAIGMYVEKNDRAKKRHATDGPERR